MGQSTVPEVFRKPRPEFPLFPRDSGLWAKKVLGKLKYFGKCIDDPKGQKALDLWNEQKDALLAGRKPHDKTYGLTVRELCSKFLGSKRPEVEVQRLSPRTFVEYTRTTDLLAGEFGKNRPVADLEPDDFEKLGQMICLRALSALE